MKIVLIRPQLDARKLVAEAGAGWKPGRVFLNRVLRYQFGVGNAIPPLALTLLAGLTPDEHEVLIMDEEVAPLDFDCDADLVGITVLTSTARRSYEIAARFRDRGVQVVLGGMHPSVLPEEAAEHADAVVVGEAEGVWHQVLADAKADSLAPIYQAQAFCDMKRMSQPRWELLSKQNYLVTNLVQASRGCPHHCSFCSVHKVYGNAFRSRPVKEVVAEITASSSRGVVFIDDNIIGDPVWAKELFTALAPLDVWWFGQVTLAIAEDDELLDLAAKSGCKALLIGFESLSQESIKRMGKSRVNTVTGYKEAIKKLHAHGIAISGNFIAGLDGDDKSSFGRLADFIISSGIGLPNMTVLMPLPGTGLFRKLTREGRILNSQYWLDPSWKQMDVIYRPKLLTPAELKEGYIHLLEQVFSAKSLIKRLRHSPNLFSLETMLPVIGYNLKKRQVARTLRQIQTRGKTPAIVREDALLTGGSLVAPLITPRSAFTGRALRDAVKPVSEVEFGDGESEQV